MVKNDLLASLSGNYRLKHISKEQVQLALGKPIEYVVGDWSQVDEQVQACEDEPEPRRLSADEEAALFRRMNYLKHQADNLRQPISLNDCPPDTLDAIERLLDDSTQLAITWYRSFLNWQRRLHGHTRTLSSASMNCSLRRISRCSGVSKSLTWSGAIVSALTPRTPSGTT